MADEAPAVAPVAPAAAPEAAAAPEPTPAAKETFQQAFERHAAKVAGTAPDAPETPEPAAPKPNGKKVVKTAEPEFEALNALAKKLGMVVDNGKIMPSDRAKFREWEKKRTESLTSTERERLSAVEKREKEVEQQIKQAQSILKAKADGDYQGLAKELGFEDWDKLQEDVIARISDPNYKRLRELEQWKEQEAEREAKTKAETEQRETQQKQAQMRAAVQKKFASEMPQSKDPLVAAMGDHPLFVNAIMRIQEENWDGSALPYERMAGMAAKGAPKSLREECKELYDRLHKAFGGQQQAAPVKARPAPGKSAPVAPSRGPEASAPKTMTREERNAYERQRLAEAIERDRRAGS
jgi:hypothetical protein